jgi:hypothetical protein
MKKDLKWLSALAVLGFLPATIKVYAQNGAKTQLSMKPCLYQQIIKRRGNKTYGSILLH